MFTIAKISRKKRSPKAKGAAKRPHKRAIKTISRHLSHKHAAKTKAAEKEAKVEKKVAADGEAIGGRRKVNINIPPQEEVRRALDTLFQSAFAIEYLKKNVSKRASDVIGMLSAPKTDEALAEQLGMKINAVRRILNIMQGYGITNYYVSKNTNGWLSFSWYINTSKLPPFLEMIESIENNKGAMSENCNDYFICNSCYKEDKFVYTFDAAFESSFKCASCSKNLQRMDSQEVKELLNSSNMAEASQKPVV